MSDSSDSDDSSNHIEAAVSWFSAALIYATEMKNLKRDREMTGAEYITRQLNGHPLLVRENYRLSPTNFKILCDELNAHGLQGSADVIIEEHVGMFLQMLGQGATIRKLAEDFQHSEETVSRSLRLVMGYVRQMMPNYIKLPGVDAPIHARVREGTKFSPLKEALGAIDGTHIPAYPDSVETFKERWRNRKGFMSQNVMVAVDFDGRFVYVVAGWEGSAHDSQVLRRSLEQGFTVPEGRYYLVDGGYANTHQFISPYRGKTYHLAQFQQRRRENRYEDAEELFNHRHAQLRNVVEKSFGILKNRFKILKEMHNYKYVFQTDIVIACCILHNFIKQHQSTQDDLEDESDNDVGVNEEDLDDDNPSTIQTEPLATQPIGTDAQRGTALRDKIRDELWNAHLSS